MEMNQQGSTSVKSVNGLIHCLLCDVREQEKASFSIRIICFIGPLANLVLVPQIAGKEIRFHFLFSLDFPRY